LLKVALNTINQIKSNQSTFVKWWLDSTTSVFSWIYNDSYQYVQILLLMGLGLWCLTSLSTKFQLYNDSQFGWNGSANTTDLSQITDNLYHIMLHGVHLARVGFDIFSGNCIRRCKSTTIRSRPEQSLLLLDI
jgi:hypothetical protein